MNSRSSRAGQDRAMRRLGGGGLVRLIVLCLLPLGGAAAAAAESYLVFGSFSDAANARSLQARLETEFGLPVRILATESGQRELDRVIAGPFGEARLASVAERTRAAGLSSWRLPATQVPPAAQVAAPAPRSRERSEQSPPVSAPAPRPRERAAEVPARTASAAAPARSETRRMLPMEGPIEGNGSLSGNGSLRNGGQPTADWLPVAAAPMLPTPGGRVNSSEALARLAEQAQFWEQRNRPGLAQDSWQRLLDADPGNEQALARLALLAYQQGERSSGDDYAARLRAAAPNSRYLDEVDRGRTLLRMDSALLEQARRASGAEAIELYERAFDGEPPSDALSLEYHQVLAGVPARRQEAVTALERLAARNPGAPRYALAHAQELVNRTATRREGIRRLHALHTQAAVRDEALAAWRQALIWLDAAPDDLSLYDQYLAAVPRDGEIIERRNRLRAQRPDSPERQRDQAIAEAFTALDRGDLPRAEQSFREILDQTPRNADALGGLGLVRLRQSRYADAHDLLEQAGRAQPRTAGRWRNALRSAGFFRDFEQGQAAAAQGDHAAALSSYRRAFDNPPDDLAPTLRLTYADALLRMDEFDAAERELRGVLDRQPGNADAQRMLAQLLTRTGRIEQAEELVASAPEQVRAAISPARAESLRERAAADRARGDSAAASEKLREALRLAPENPWVRLDLARLLREEGRHREADDLLATLQRTHGDLPEVRLARAFALAEQQRWLETLYELERLPPRDRDRDARTLQRRAWINQQIARGEAAAELGDARTARRLLEAADIAADGDREFLGALARGWAAVGDSARALDYMRRSFRDQAPTLDERIQYSGLLLSLGHNTEFEAVVEEILGETLGPAQQAQLEEQIVGYRLRLADAAREDGDLGAAYELLRDVAQRRPRDADVQLGLARIFTDAGDHDRALSLFDSVLEQDADNRDAIYGSAEAALAMGDLNIAERRVRDARRIDPEAARAHDLAGRLAEARGQTRLAIRHYEQAQRQRERREPELAGGPPQLQLIDRDDAFGGLPARLEPAPRRAEPLRPRPTDGPAVPRREPDRSAPLGLPTRISEQPVTPLRVRPSEQREPSQPWSSEVTAPPMEVRRPVAEPSRPRPASEPLAFDDARPPQAALTRLRADASGWAAGGFHARIRDGESGLSELTNLELPMALRFPESRLGRFGLHLTPVLLDAGSVSGDAVQRFGALPLDLPDEDFSLSQNDAGLAVALVLDLGDLTADIGVTPIGFERRRITGGLRWAPDIGNWRLGVELARRPVTESLLAYAGTRDPVTGATWGGVNRNRLGFDVAYDAGRYGAYGSFGGAVYDGHRIDDNVALDFGAGVFFRGWRSDNHALTYGVDLTAFGYQKNRRHFTFGHGGYFSPAHFVSLAVPVQLAGSWNELNYRVYGSLGVQNFREDAANYFPSNPVLQAELMAAIAEDPDSPLMSRFASASRTGLGYSFGIDLEYALSPQMFVGGHFFTDNARDFNEFQFSGYLRYFFREQYRRTETPQLLPGHYNWTQP